MTAPTPRRPRQFAEMNLDGARGMKIVPIVREDSPWDSNNADEMMWWPRTLWIDPGKVSGVAVVWFDPMALLRGDPIPRCVLATAAGYFAGPEVEQARDYIRLFSMLDRSPGMAAGVESFVIGQFNQSDDFLSPVRIRAMIDFWFGSTNRTLWSQGASDAKTSITDQRLQIWGMYTAGPDHIRDALRHCLLWLRRVRLTEKEGIIRMHGNETGWWS